MATPARGAPGTAVVPKEGMPNQTLYCRNLPDKMHKDDLKQNLHMLFSTYGPVIDIVALKTMKMRGQAHIAMRDVDTATQAMRALQGFSFFGKEMQIAYAKGKSDTIAKLDGTYKMPEVEREAKEGQENAPAQTSGFGAAPAKAVPVNAADVAKGQKRAREEEEEDEDDAEMEMDVSDEDSD